MIPRKRIEAIGPGPAPHARNNDRHVASAWMFEGVLVLDVYDARMTGEPVPTFRWACDGKNYACYDFPSGSWGGDSIAAAMYGSAEMAGYVSGDDLRIAEGKDEVLAFLKEADWHGYWAEKLACHQGGLEGVLKLEDMIRDEKRGRGTELREARMLARRERRRPLPEDWEAWIRESLFSGSRYLFYEGRKRNVGRCAFCGEEVALDGRQRHNGKGTCPSCGSRVTYKAQGRTCLVKERKVAILVQRTEGGILVRNFMVWKASGTGGENYVSLETEIDTLKDGKLWEDYAVWINGKDFWQERRRPWELSQWKPEGTLYTGNLPGELAGTEFRYAPLVELAGHEVNVPVKDFLLEYRRNGALEFLVKMGLFRLTREVARNEAYLRHGRSVREVLRIDRGQAKRLAAMDGGGCALEWLQRENAGDGAVSDADLEWFQENGLQPHNVELPLRAARGNAGRVAAYMRKQEGMAEEFAEGSKRPSI